MIIEDRILDFVTKQKALNQRSNIAGAKQYAHAYEIVEDFIKQQIKYMELEK